MIADIGSVVRGPYSQAVGRTCWRRMASAPHSVQLASLLMAGF
ncbi:MAG TPA: hypothetical protein VM452_02755 [Caulifigura sp.]|nr:hypothetical protein [Caulifigura sp.]